MIVPASTPAGRRVRTSPCIGICSTTYGDLVCRGCKRFAHEVVDWNRYDDGQRTIVWTRLAELRDASVSSYLAVVDEALLARAAAKLHLSAMPDQTALTLAYETLRRTRVVSDLAALGLAPARTSGGPAPDGVFAAIDREFHTRAAAAYERNFRIPSR